MKCITTFLFISLLIFSCTNTSNTKGGIEINNDSATFFPIKDFIQKEFNHISSTPFLFIKKEIKENSLIDSSQISVDSVVALAQVFLKYSPENNKNIFKESVFEDVSTDSYTISYTCVNKDYPLQQLDVLLDRTTEQPKRLFFLVKESNGQTSLFWKKGSYFQINITPSQSNKSITQQIIWNWDDK